MVRFLYRLRHSLGELHGGESDTSLYLLGKYPTSMPARRARRKTSALVT